MTTAHDRELLGELEQLRRLARVLDSTTDGIAVYDLEWRFVYVNKKAEELGGKPAEELLGRVFWEVFPEPPDSPHKWEIMRVAAEGTPAHFELYSEPLDKWFEIHAYPMEDGVTAYYHDISKRKRAELELRAREQMYRRIIEAVPAGLVHVLPDGAIAYANEQARALLGLSLDEVTKRYVSDFKGETVTDDGSPLDPEDYPVSKCLRTGEPSGPSIVGVRRPDGSVSWGVYTAVPLHDAKTEAVNGAVVTFVDITQRKRAEAALCESEQRFAAFMDNNPSVAFMKDGDGRMVYVNRRFEQVFGFEPERDLGKTDFDMLPEEVAREVRSHDETVLASGKGTELVEVVPTPDGQERTWIVYKFPFTDSAGRVFLGGVAADLTDRLKLEEQLQHARKMEAIGRLAGGIAHDFNNLMTIVGGYATFLLRSLGDDHPLYRDAEQIRRAAERATLLTRQLLAFGRRQILRPHVVDLNAVIGDITKMLDRLLGEDVSVQLRLSPDLGHVRIDPGQLEQVLVNLAINAREAMAEGGRLTIETWNERVDEPRLLRHDRIEPGSYVALSIADTGSGMDPKTLAHLFEPFFSTKEFGRGLGLSSIYGIVKQSGGSISVASHMGKGTNFTIFLPRVPEGVAEEVASEPYPGPTSRGETILLVEDDEDVRSLVEEMLEQHGYSTLQTVDPAEALLVCESHPGPIHLLVADVVMPKMSGPQLAEQLSLVRPDMRVLFISGYVENEATRRAVSAGRAAFLAKPFTPEEFMRKVREVMEG